MNKQNDLIQELKDMNGIHVGLYMYLGASKEFQRRTNSLRNKMVSILDFHGIEVPTIAEHAIISDTDFEKIQDEKVKIKALEMFAEYEELSSQWTRFGEVMAELDLSRND